MIKILVLVLALSAFVMLMQDSSAQQIPEFVEEIPTDIRAPPEITTPAVSNATYVNVNLDALNQPKMQLSIFDETIEITHERTSLRSETDYVYVGTIENGYVYISVIDSMIRMEMSGPGKNYVITVAGDDHMIQKMNPNQYGQNWEVQPESNHQSDELTGSFALQSSLQTLSRHIEIPQQIRDGEKITIDVLFFYTNNASKNYGQVNINRISFIAIEKTNDAFDYNDLPIEINEIDTSNIRDRDFSESNDLATDLDKLVATNDNNGDYAHTLRNTTNADIVILYVDHNDQVECGKAKQVQADADSAFIVINVNCERESDMGLVVGHQIGHLLGGAHARAEYKSDSAPVPYAHAFVNDAGDYATLMSLDCGAINSTDCSWQRQWSDPHKTLFFTASASGTHEYENNAIVVFDYAPTVASFRGQTQSYAFDIYDRQGSQTIQQDDFQMDLSKWTLTQSRDESFNLRTVAGLLPPFATALNYTIAYSEDCSIKCAMASESMNLSRYESAYLNFWFYASAGMGSNEGVSLEISTNGGNSWTEIAEWDGGDYYDDGYWHYVTNFDLGDHLAHSDVKLKLVATTSSEGEIVQIGNYEVRGDPLSDTIPPIITVPDDVVGEATGILTKVDIGAATATDNVDPSPAITNDAPAGGFSLGVTTITWTATDDANNSAAAMQTVTIRDTTPPVITVPADASFDATGTLTALARDDYGTATATDLVDPHPSITNNAPTSFPIGTTTVTWTATDSSNNSASATQTITLNLGAIQDAVRPEIAAPPDITAEAAGSLTAVDIGQAVATDNVDPSPAVTNDAPASFPLGTTIVTWTATDDSGNTAADTQSVTIRDTTPPTISAHGDVTRLFEPGTAHVVTFDAPAAADTVDPDIEVSCTPESGSVFALGTTTVICTATDDSGNTASTSFGVTVDVSLSDSTDTYPPVIVPSDDYVVEATGTLTDVNIGTAFAFDDADPSPTITHNAPALFPLGTTVVTWTATDGSGNSASANQTVTVLDRVPPAMGGVSDFSKFFSSGASFVVDYVLPSAFDLVDGVVAPACDPASGSLFLLGTNLVFCSVSDSSGNSAFAIFYVFVNSTEASSESFNLRAAATADSVDLSWDVADSDHISNYELRRSSAPDSSSYDFVFYLPAALDSYADSHNIVQGATYYYHFSTLNQQLRHIASQTISVSVPNSDSALSVLDDSDNPRAVSAAGRVSVTFTDVSSDSVFLRWDSLNDAADYKVVIAPSDSPRLKFADIVAGGNEYRFVNLEPDTPYDVRVGVRGDDSTQTVFSIVTGGKPFDSLIDLGVNIVNGKILLSWDDSNSIGENRYRVERSVDGAGYEMADLSPRFDAFALDAIQDDWAGKTVTYKVFERLGKQKLFSDEVSVLFP